ncbi:PspC domain-containing protein [Maribacter confluentis]|uniref:Phage shock protein C (PspC) family protein n=2 Tax=Maribacter TaxID=252356 RepID=A0ABY1SFQ1_9FLAO|nr:MULTISPECIES: PspC domain-containing protein [Maribacter]MDO1511476.1 PspC domain-containing protein [Maribacter confluentis]TVZ14683.1 phage shock protein C (PspC) family protein [Maribacter sp. MAR_2009_72]SNR41541.1 phage shock protein C (PspC) family protein [Maribacter sedimenticola]
MNKTVNINLANMLFHIDEEAYNKMRRYLESVKRSFANTPGSDEIIADIEARIAELFHEKLENDRQVITHKEVDEVIAIMGQPEDYMVDEEIFEDEPRAKSTGTKTRVKKLFRDTDKKYVAGVSSGLAHYFGIDPLWIRLIWIFLTIFTWGGFIFIYGLLWILIPEAKTTSQKLDMSGQAVNISNIERKVKEGFDDVADRVKSVDYEKVGDTVKKGGKTIFDTFGDIVMFIFKIFGKFIGILLVIIGATTLIGLFVGMFTVGILDVIHVPGIDFYNVVNSTNMPIWVVSLLAFFAIGIPFFFLMYLGLKILVNNLKSIGSIAKFSLLGLWLISIILLIVFGIREAASHAYTGSTSVENEITSVIPSDTIALRIITTDEFDYEKNMHMGDTFISYDEAGNKILVSDDVRFRIRKSKDSLVRIQVRKEADGPSNREAKEIAEQINYDYEINGNTISLNDYLTTQGPKFKDQEVRVNVFLPVGTILTYEQDNSRNWITTMSTDRDVDNLEGYVWEMQDNGELHCLDCPDYLGIQNEDENKNRININGQGIDININGNGEKGKIMINENGIDIDVNDNGEMFKMKVDENGVKINANDSIN